MSSAVQLLAAFSIVHDIRSRVAREKFLPSKTVPTSSGTGEIQCAGSQPGMESIVEKLDNAAVACLRALLASLTCVSMCVKGG